MKHESFFCSRANALNEESAKTCTIQETNNVLKRQKGRGTSVSSIMQPVHLLIFFEDSRVRVQRCNVDSVPSDPYSAKMGRYAAIRKPKNFEERLMRLRAQGMPKNFRHCIVGKNPRDRGRIESWICYVLA